jgi:hypothetical protein
MLGWTAFGTAPSDLATGKSTSSAFSRVATTIAYWLPIAARR